MYKVTSKSTTFGIKTPFGLKTPFKYPTYNGSTLASIVSGLAIQLYPTGRAFNMFKDDIKDKLHTAFNVSFIRFIQDAQATIDSTIPDTDNFSDDDCALWEYRFGMVTNTALSTLTRRQAIARRMARGRNIPARAHIKYLEYAIQQAGFNVYLHENGFLEGGVWVYKTPQEIMALSLDMVEHGSDTQHGVGTQHGGTDAQIIANSYKPNELFSVSDENLWASFFIGGETLGTSADVPLNRLEEFKELVLKLKSAHLVALTFINYV